MKYVKAFYLIENNTKFGVSFTFLILVFVNFKNDLSLCINSDLSCILIMSRQWLPWDVM